MKYLCYLAQAHAKFERIYKFNDGNGRTGRLIIFAMALQNVDVSPIVSKEKRSAYYKYLEAAQAKESLELLEYFIASATIVVGETLLVRPWQLRPSCRECGYVYRK